MSWQSNRVFIKARNIGRVLGLNKLLARALFRGGYEVRFDKVFSSMIHPGDTVWDVGANVGYYTRIFSECVGDSGKVFAFEPSPINCERLEASCETVKNIVIYPIGLGNKSSTLTFLQGLDELGATSRILDANAKATSADGIQSEVTIRAASDLVRNEGIPSPNVIKIDVEGFELEVLQGFDNVLTDPCLHLIGVEVHFQLLQERGLRDAPKRVSELLKQSGFKIQWTDSSHIIATRVSA